MEEMFRKYKTTTLSHTFLEGHSRTGRPVTESSTSSRQCCFSSACNNNEKQSLIVYTR